MRRRQTRDLRSGHASTPASGRSRVDDAGGHQAELFGDDVGAATVRAPSFFNTTRESADVVAQYIEQCGRQQAKVVELFLRKPDSQLTPFDVQRQALPDAPITSVRRAMTNLTTAGLLVRTDSKKLGSYGRVNFCWKLAPSYRTAMADALDLAVGLAVVDGMESKP